MQIVTGGNLHEMSNPVFFFVFVFFLNIYIYISLSTAKLTKTVKKVKLQL